MLPIQALDYRSWRYFSWGKNRILNNLSFANNAVIGWIIMRVIAVMTPALNLPDWLDSFFALLLIAGFPLALFFEWAFELTPEAVSAQKWLLIG